jgi:hypothetical protein
MHCLDMITNTLQIKPDSTFSEHHSGDMGESQINGRWNIRNGILNLNADWVEPEMTVSEFCDSTLTGITVIVASLDSSTFIPNPFWFDTLLTPLYEPRYKDEKLIVTWMNRHSFSYDSISFTAGTNYIFKHKIENKCSNIFEIALRLPKTFWNYHYSRTLLLARDTLYIVDGDTVPDYLKPCAFIRQ